MNGQGPVGHIVSLGYCLPLHVWRSMYPTVYIERYDEGTEGHYMPRESFLNLRKYERMIEKITLPTPIHLLDHIIIPIHIRKSHWFPVHINLRTRSISLLGSSQVYSAAAYLHQRMLIWKFLRMVWTTHADAAAPVPYWTHDPSREVH